MFIAHSIDIDKNENNNRENFNKKPGILATIIVFLIGAGIIGSLVMFANSSNTQTKPKDQKGSQGTIETTDNTNTSNNGTLNNNTTLNTTKNITPNEIKDEINNKNKDKNNNLIQDFNDNDSNKGSGGEKLENNMVIENKDGQKGDNAHPTYIIQIDEKNIHKKDDDAISNGESIVKKSILKNSKESSKVQIDSTKIIRQEFEDNNEKANIINGKSENKEGYLNTAKQVVKAAAVAGGVGALYYLSTSDIVGGTVAGAGLAASYLYNTAKNITTYK